MFPITSMTCVRLEGEIFSEYTEWEAAGESKGERQMNLSFIHGFSDLNEIPMSPSNSHRPFAIDFKLVFKRLLMTISTCFSICEPLKIQG